MREIADLVVRGNKGAMRGLELLGWERNVDSVGEALDLLCNVLNTQLSQMSKELFHEREVGYFDVEHVLCKFSRKQGKHRTMPIVCTKTAATKGGMKRKLPEESISEQSKRRR